MGRPDGENMQFILDTTLNSTDYKNGMNFAVGRNYDNNQTHQSLRSRMVAIVSPDVSTGEGSPCLVAF